MTVRTGAADVIDPVVSTELLRVLGAPAVQSLFDAFESEWAVRPQIIAQQIADGDISGARASAHYLRGAALVVGARSVADASAQIEMCHDDVIAEKCACLLSLK